MTAGVLSAFTVIAKALEKGLGYMEEREKNYPQKRAAAFKQRLHSIKKDYYKEYNREENRSRAVLDNLYFQLCQLVDDFDSTSF